MGYMTQDMSFQRGRIGVVDLSLGIWPLCISHRRFLICQKMFFRKTFCGSLGMGIFVCRGRMRLLVFRSPTRC